MFPCIVSREIHQQGAMGGAAVEYSTIDKVAEDLGYTTDQVHALLFKILLPRLAKRVSGFGVSLTLPMCKFRSMVVSFPRGYQI
jgi:hypothetical protein